MKKSTIQFTVELDQNNVPDRILWEATDKPEEGSNETKAISIALWDHTQRNTMRIDLWAKDMPVDDMKRFILTASVAYHKVHSPRLLTNSWPKK
jgi:gliding motility-associated protein GldC